MMSLLPHFPHEKDDLLRCMDGELKSESVDEIVKLWDTCLTMGDETMDPFFESINGELANQIDSPEKALYAYFCAYYHELESVTLKSYLSRLLMVLKQYKKVPTAKRTWFQLFKKGAASQAKEEARYNALLDSLGERVDMLLEYSEENQDKTAEARFNQKLYGEESVGEQLSELIENWRNMKDTVDTDVSRLLDFLEKLVALDKTFEESGTFFKLDARTHKLMAVTFVPFVAQTRWLLAKILKDEKLTEALSLYPYFLEMLRCPSNNGRDQTLVKTLWPIELLRRFHLLMSKEPVFQNYLERNPHACEYCQDPAIQSKPSTEFMNELDLDLQISGWVSQICIREYGGPMKSWLPSKIASERVNKALGQEMPIYNKDLLNLFKFHKNTVPIKASSPLKEMAMETIFHTALLGIEMGVSF